MTYVHISKIIHVCESENCSVVPSICIYICQSVSQLCPTLKPQGLGPTKLLYPWDFSGKNTGESWHFLLQGIFPTQGSNLCLLPWQVDSLQLSHLGSPKARITDNKTENTAFNQDNHWGPIKTLNSSELPCLALFVFIDIHERQEIKNIPMTSQGKKEQNLSVWYPRGHFPLANLNLYLYPVINCNHEYTGVSWVLSSRDLSNLRMIWRTSSSCN